MYQEKDSIIVMIKNGDEIIDSHWEYNRVLMKLCIQLDGDMDISRIDKILELCEYCYKTAWVHGAKHEREDA